MWICEVVTVIGAAPPGAIRFRPNVTSGPLRGSMHSMSSTMTRISDRLEIVTASHPGQVATFAEDFAIGLQSPPRTLPAKYFYDDLGSALFEAITRLPEYYLTRAET